MRREMAAAGKVLLAIVAVPIAIVAALLIAPFARGEDRTPSEVASYLRNFLDGSGGEWDWDDFISTPITDPALEGIRTRAAAVELPLTREGIATLRQLLTAVEQLVST